MFYHSQWEAEMAKLKRTMYTQAARIDQVLQAHNLPARVVGGSLTPRAFRFELKAAGEIRVETLAPLSSEIAHATGSREAIFTAPTEDGLLRLELARPRTEHVRLLELCARLNEVPPLTALLGLDSDGSPLLLRLPSPAVGHVLIAGMTGSGKTALARTLITSLCMLNPPDSLQMVLVDPKRRGFGALKVLPHLLGDVVTTPEEAIDCLRWVGEQLVLRERTPKTPAGDAPLPALVVVIDELTDLLQQGGKRMETLVTQVAQRGGAVGIHLVACMQKPTAGLIGSGIKGAFPLRLVGAVASSEEARYACGLNDSGAEQLVGSGDFLLVAGGQLMRFQAAWLKREELNAIAAELRRPQGAARSWRALADALAPPPPPPPAIIPSEEWREPGPILHRKGRAAGPLATLRRLFALPR